MKQTIHAYSRLLWVCLLMVGSVSVALAQTAISGTLTDGDNGEPLIGANILVVGTDVGTATDFDGNYEVTVPSGATQLRISYAGYATQVVEIVAGQTTYNMTMSAGELLDEVVVVGYGTQTQSEVTSAAVSVKEEDFNQGVVNNPTQLVQGKVAGLQIAQPGGDPNGTPSIRLRGLSTLGANTEPLVIIDGVIGASLNVIDPSDIESIDVLKDGSAAAIYGTRASSGVLIVTTKSGVDGEPRVSYRVQGGVESLARGVQVASAERYAELRGSDFDFGARNDYIDELTDDAFSQVHNLSFSGGGNGGNYRASLNYRDIDGVAVGTGFDQINGRLNVSQKAMDDKLTFNLVGSMTSRNSSRGFNSAFRYATIYNPTLPVTVNEPDGPSANGYQVLGGYTQIDQFDYFNPIAIAELNSNRGVTRDALVSGKVTYSPIENLNIAAQYAVTTQTGTFESFESKFSRGLGADRNGFAQRTSIDRRDNLFELTANYIADLSDNIELDLLGGYSYQQFFVDRTSLSAGNFVTDVIGVNALQFSQDVPNGQALISSGGDRSELESYFARAGLNFDDTYFLQASLRSDGSTRFGADEKRGLFYAVSGGVDLQKFVSSPSVDRLKFRVGYGVTGNLPGSSLNSISQYSVAGSYPIGGDPNNFQPGAIISANANSGLRFERKSELNVGLDFAFMDYKLTGTVDYFRRNTDDLLFNVTVPVGGVSPNGDIFFTNTILANLDDVVFRNEGVELSLGYAITPNDKFSYEPRVVFSTVKTTLDSVDNANPVYEFFPGQGTDQFNSATSPGAPGQNDAPTQIVRAGQEIGQIYTYVYSGIDDTGDYIFEDLNGDGDITINGTLSPDKRVVGSGLPDWTLGFANTFTYGNWNANIFFRGAFGHSLANMPRNFYENTAPTRGTDNVVITELFDPALAPNELRFNSLYVEKADYLVLDNASIGYNFDLPSDSKLRSVNLALSGQRLFYITNYTGVDPEVQYADNVDPQNLNILAPGIDRRNNYFRTRTFNLALTVGF